MVPLLCSAHASNLKGEIMGPLHAETEVTGMVHSGIAFDTIESRIEEISGLTSDQRSALWLYAWSRQESAWQRGEAGQLLRAVMG